MVEHDHPAVLRRLQLMSLQQPWMILKNCWSAFWRRPPPVWLERMLLETAALKAVLAGVETENTELKAEVARLNARLKEGDNQSKTRLKWLAERVATLENDLSLRIRPHEVGGMMHARLLEGINVGRRVARLIDPNFPVQFINCPNRAALHKDDLVEEPRDIQGPPPPP
ncbi:hypothetical protein Nepgr_018683 [Nepenthes gracilis]|uniref:Uncharacterized protein n=1 Tax=Nepenthes gracilis TaxID=150966 RepID=A0AAD3XT98_NEPGR|nr:hypothetical protein Nepgr_018683 [Nepenthes gracilis]